MKLLFFILTFIFFYSNETPSALSDKRVIKNEAKYFCKCDRSYDKKLKKLEQRQKREEKKWQHGTDRLFGGYSLEFNFEECIDAKRSNKEKRYFDGLNEAEKKKFKRKVKSAIRKQCPKSKVKFYGK